MKYYVRDTFFARISNGQHENLKYIEELDNNKTTIKYIIENNPQFLEALAVSSPSLYNTIKKGKIEEDQEIAIVRYFIRFLERPTPYGLFSGVTSGSFNELTAFVRKETFFKFCSVDMEWFYYVMNKVEKTLLSSGDLRVKFNEQCIIRGETIINPYISSKYVKDNRNKMEEVKKIYARYSRQVENVKKIASEWITYSELNEVMNRINSEIDAKVISAFLKKLLENEILITECRRPISEKDSLEDLLELLSAHQNNGEYNELSYTLNKINMMRKEYNQQEIGKGIENYEKLCTLMKQVGNSGNYLNVISGIEMQHNCLSIKVKEAIEEFLPILVKLSIDSNENYYVKSYKERFVDVYGGYREVSLLELLDENVGLGNPYKANSNEHNTYNRREEQIKKVLENKICLALRNNLNEIDINKEEIDKIPSIDEDLTELEYVKSFELNVKILAASAQDIDKGNFRIKFAPCSGSNAAGQMINRFYNILEKDAKKELSDIYQELQEILYKDVEIADVTYLPRQGRLNNICSGKRNYKYAVNCGIDTVVGQQKILLSDILVGYSSKNRRLYLRDASSGKKMRVLSDNMLTSNIDNYIVRFLREVTYSNEIQSGGIWSFLRNINLKYTPTLVYKNIIIQPETWRIDKSDFSNLKSLSEFTKEFKKLMEVWKIPPYIHIMKEDHYILLDLSLGVSWKCLFKESQKIFKQKESYLIQVGESQKDIWIQSLDGKHYQAEFVVECLAEEKSSLSIKKEIPLTLSKVNKNVGGQGILKDERAYQPGINGWFYFKIYMDEEQADEFIGNEISSFMEILLEHQLIQKFFFLRYADPDFHIRLRVQSCTGNDIIEKMQEWFHKLKKSEKIRSFVVATYEREIERYGGITAINYAEEVFFRDSFLVCNILESDMDQEIATIVSVYNLFYTIFGDDLIIEDFLNQIIEPMSYHGDFRKRDKEYIKIILEAREISKKENLQDLEAIRCQKVAEYYSVLNYEDENGRLTNSLKDIILSLSHMTCNRLRGDSLWERKIYAMIRHSLHVLNEKRKHLVKDGEGRK